MQQANGKARPANGGSYTAAATSDQETEEPGTDKTARSKWDRAALACCGLGFFLLLSSLVAGFLLPVYINSRISGAMVLQEGEPAFLGWMHPPVTPVMKVGGCVIDYYMNLSFLSWHLQNLKKKGKS